MPHISLAAETIITIGGKPISNSFLTTYVVMALLFLASAVAVRKLTIIPSYTQIVAEGIIGGLYDFFASVTGKHIAQFFPILASIFIFIIVSNWIGLLPGVGTVGIFRQGEAHVQKPLPRNVVSASETSTTPEALVPQVETQASAPKQAVKFVPLFRAPTADLNTTIALALTAVCAIQYYGFKIAGFHYSTRFLNVTNPILFAVGILELASDLSKIISFAFRLFGNIFAGEVLLAVIASLIPYIVPLPFLTLELFVGFIQALVFSMLTAVFLNVAVSHGEEAHQKEVRVHG